MKSAHKVVGSSVGGALLLAYGGGAIAVSRFAEIDTNLVWWAQVLAVLAVGVGCLVWAARSATEDNKNDVPDEPVKPDNVAHPVSFSDGGTAEAVHTLARRMSGAKDSEGLQLCRKLHDCLFVLEYTDTPDDPNKLSA